MPLDIFDEIELSAEDKLILSEEFKNFLEDKIRKELKQLDVEAIASKIIKKEIASLKMDNASIVSKMKGIMANDVSESKKDSIKKMFLMVSELKNDMASKMLKVVDSHKISMDSAVDSAKSEMAKKLDEAAEKQSVFISETKKEQDSFMEKMRKKIDDMMNKIINEPKYEFGGFSPQFNDLNIGDPATEGSWRIVKSGNNLNVERYESGSWVEKGHFEP